MFLVTLYTLIIIYIIKACTYVCIKKITVMMYRTSKYTGLYYSWWTHGHARSGSVRCSNDRYTPLRRSVYEHRQICLEEYRHQNRFR